MEIPLVDRSADYTIQGFLYQFNKTLIEILNDTEDSSIAIEGIIEDIEIQTDTEIRAIQCKYHEAKDNFTLSSAYKPILQMMMYFHNNTDRNINYKIYAYFPNKTAGDIEAITNDQIKQVLNSEDKSLQKYISVLKGNIDEEEFLNRFTLEFGLSLDDIQNNVCQALKNNGIPEQDIDTLIYPNAIQIIADLSILHEAEKRTIKKAELLDKLLRIKNTAITRWTRSLKTIDKILNTLKKQLKANLDKNSRSRYFIISDSALADFSECIVVFINEYLSKYHFKEIHNKTPLFCLDCSEQSFDDIRIRIHRKGIRLNDGYIVNYFDKHHFMRDPIIRVRNKKERDVEFLVRIMRYSEDSLPVLNEYKCDDLFIISDQNYPGLDTKDVNIEQISLSNIHRIKYVLGMCDTYE